MVTDQSTHEHGTLPLNVGGYLHPVTLRIIPHPRFTATPQAFRLHDVSLPQIISIDLANCVTKYPAQVARALVCNTPPMMPHTLLNLVVHRECIGG